MYGEYVSRDRNVDALSPSRLQYKKQFSHKEHRDHKDHILLRQSNFSLGGGESLLRQCSFSAIFVISAANQLPFLGSNARTGSNPVPKPPDRSITIALNRPWNKCRILPWRRLNQNTLRIGSPASSG
jgi:hypothetical protein